MRRRLALLLAIPTAALAQAKPEAPAIQPIRFARGTSSAVVSDAVVRGDRAIYSLDVAKGQEMTVAITAEEDNAVFQIYRPGARVLPPRDGVTDIAGRTLPGAAEGEDARRWNGILPDAGRYLIVVGGTRGNASFRLTVGVK